MSHRPCPLFKIAIFAISILLLACSNAPPVSKVNQHLADAKNSLKSSDFDGALSNLDKAIKSAPDESSRQQALVLRTALVTAIADANKQMAEAYYIGAKQPSAQPHSSSFFKMRSDYYRTANSSLMDAMQMVMDQRSKLSSNGMPMNVDFPGFTGTNPGMARIKSGQLISDSDRLSAELQAERNAFAVVLSEIGGAGQDPDKGQQLFSSGKVDLDSRVYIIELSDNFLETGDMFDFRGLNQPDRQRTVDQVVRGNLDVSKKLLAAKPDKVLEERNKKLEADCDSRLKKLTK